MRAEERRQRPMLMVKERPSRNDLAQQYRPRLTHQADPVSRPTIAATPSLNFRGERCSSAAHESTTDNHVLSGFQFRPHLSELSGLPGSPKCWNSDCAADATSV